MAEQDEQTGEEAASGEAEGPVGGERLAAARREQQVSVVEVAKELHLDETKVRALERNEFDLLGAAVFAKGHLRKYAELVGVDPDDVLTDYYQLTRGAGAPPVVVGRRRPRRELSPGPWIAAIIVALAVAVAYWWFGVREPATAPQPASVPVESAPVDAADEANGAADEGPDEVVEPEAAAAPPPEQPASEPAASTAEAPAETAVAEPAPEQAAASQPVDDRMRLTISFTGDCWTEISDADGRRLYFGMGRDGQTVDLAGRAPVSVLFGNGANVGLFVDGSEYELPPVNASNQTIRLSLAKTG